MVRDLAWHVGSLQWIFTEWTNENLLWKKNQICKMSFTDLDFIHQDFGKIWELKELNQHEYLLCASRRDWKMSYPSSLCLNMTKQAWVDYTSDPLKQRAETRTPISFIVLFCTFPSAVSLLGIKYPRDLCVYMCFLRPNVIQTQDCTFQVCTCWNNNNSHKWMSVVFWKRYFS